MTRISAINKEDREAFEEAVEIAVERLQRGEAEAETVAYLKRLDYVSAEFALNTAQRELRKQRQEASNVIPLFPTPVT